MSNLENIFDPCSEQMTSDLVVKECAGVIKDALLGGYELEAMRYGSTPGWCVGTPPYPPPQQ